MTNRFSALCVFLLAVIAILAVCSGCRKASVEQQTRRIETALLAGEPPHFVRAASAAPETQPWFADLQIVLDEKPKDEKELEVLLEQHKPAAKNAIAALLQDIKTAVDGQRREQDKWSLLSMSCGKPRRSHELQFSADVVLTTLYVRRPAISFNNVPLDLSIAKLCRECGIHDSQPRGYNPRIYWSRLNVSAFEAIEAILNAHGYTRRFSEISQQIALKLNDFASREEFVKAAAQAALDAGKLINQARPALIVTAKERQPETPPAPAKR